MRILVALKQDRLFRSVERQEIAVYSQSVDTPLAWLCDGADGGACAIQHMMVRDLETIGLDVGSYYDAVYGTAVRQLPSDWISAQRYTSSGNMSASLMTADYGQCRRFRS